MAGIISVKSMIEALGAWGEINPKAIKQELGVDEVVYTGVVEIGASASHTVDFGVITTATFVFMRVNSGATYLFNGGSTPAMTINSGGWQMLFNTAVTGLVVTETSSAAMNLEVLLGGT